MDSDVKAKLKSMVDAAARGKTRQELKEKQEKSSKYIGVTYMKDQRTKRWRARVRGSRKLGNGNLYVDYFHTEIEAAKAYDEAVLLLCPLRKNMKLNFPNRNT
jgi:hypothetical protein